MSEIDKDIYYVMTIIAKAKVDWRKIKMNKDLMPQVLAGKGNIMNKKMIYDKLVELNLDDPFCKQKASGSIGGSKTHGYIADAGNNYICQR